jgi:hypothetical protein
MTRLPPHNLDAEQCVLGSILVQEGMLEKIIGLLSPEDFYGDAHQEIYAAMLALREKNNPQDLITVANLLKERNRLERAGGPAYLAGLTEIVPFASRISHYARIVQEKAILRRLIRTTSEITSRCYQGHEDIGNLLEDARRVGDVVLSATSLPEKIDLAATFSGPPPELDWVWPGFLAGTVGVLVAAGGTGKSYWALQAAMAVADGSGDSDLLGLAPAHGGRVNVDKSSSRNGMADQQQAARGASALVDNARWGGYLCRMSAAESARLADAGRSISLERRSYYLRFGVSKQNYGILPPERWYERLAGGVLRPVALTSIAAGRSASAVPLRNKPGGDDDW